MELVPASVTAGAILGSPVTVQGWGCPPPTFSVGGSGQVLVSYCGAQARVGSAYENLPGSLAAAAWAGMVT
jgi:hypothetical protein